MKKRCMILFLSFFCLFYGIGQNGGAELIQSGHWTFDALRYLAMESGIVTLASFAPVTRHELGVHLNAISREALSAEGRSVYDSVSRYLDGQEPLAQNGFGSFDFRPVASVSALLRQNSDLELLSDKIERFNSTKPFLSLPISVSFADRVAARLDFSLTEGYWASTLERRVLSVPLDADSFDMNTPRDAYLAVGNGYLSAVIGRGPLQIGEAVNGSLLLSDSADRLNYASLAMFSRNIRFFITPIELTPHRFAYFHGISFRPRPNLAITLSEAATVNAPLDLRYLNPAMIYHSYAGWKDDYGQEDDVSPVGTEFAATVEIVPMNNWRLYGQFVMNQFQTAYERENFAETALLIPNSLGGLAGLEHSRILGDGYLSMILEGVYTNPWLYILSNRDISFYWSRRELVAPSGYTNKAITGWLGSPFGPDTLAVTLQGKYFVPQKYTLEGSYRFILQGRNGELFFLDETGTYYPETVDEAVLTTPSSSAFFQHRLSLSGTMNINEKLGVEALGWCALNGGASLGYSLGTSLGISYQLR